MKQLFLLTTLLLAGCLYGFSQDTVFLKRKNQVPTVTVTDRAPQAFFAELYGRAGIFSVNYDRRFSKRLDGLGFTVGAGYIGVDNVSLVSVPVTVNYLLGKNGKYFEMGAGATYFSATINDLSTASEHGHTVVGTMTFGYRSQPVKGGFMFRAGINPFFFKNVFFPYWPYVSFGYNF
ncbi:MAG TPA: hypothetical protein VGM41_01335 [Chitinophagaceae bacterium]|jgi:hypothetical protein